MSFLAVSDLTVRYRDAGPAVDGVSFALDSGEIVGVSGPSGCGKTTLALALMGLLPAETTVSGSIRFRGRELVGRRDGDSFPARGSDIGMVFQESSLALNPLLSVGGQIADVVLAHERCSRRSAAARARHALVDVGFGPDDARIYDAYPHELSGGQRQRILVAQAIVCRPRLVIADEPVASVDTEVRVQVLRLIRRLNEQLGITFLLITHSADVLEAIASRVITMHAGRLVGSGTGPRRRASPGQPASVSLRPSTRVTRSTTVEVTGLTKRYSHRRVLGRTPHAVDALRGVDLRIECGATLGLTGPSGCGKSTLARCLAGLEAPDTGAIRFHPEAPAQSGSSARGPFQRQVQLIFQDAAAALNPRFTALELIAEPLVIQRIGTPHDRRNRAADLMTQVGLSADRLGARPAAFSGGERQRLAIARALAVEPRLLILDEAFAGLDLATRARLIRLLADLQAAHGLTYVCISHDLELLADMSSDLAVMRAGRVVWSGPATGVWQAPEAQGAHWTNAASAPAAREGAVA